MRLDLKLKEATQRRTELATRVEKQNITDVELQQISSMRTQLERQSAAAATKHLQLTESMMDLEVKSSQATDRLEKLITSYMDQAISCGLVPRGPTPFEHVDFSLELGSEIGMEEIRPSLVQLKKNSIQERLSSTDQVILTEEKVLRLNETFQEQRESLESLETSVVQLAKRLEEDKEV